MLTHKHHVTLIWNMLREIAAILRVTHIQANILTKARGHIMDLTHAKILDILYNGLSIQYMYMYIEPICGPTNQFTHICTYT